MHTYIPSINLYVAVHIYIYFLMALCAVVQTLHIIIYYFRQRSLTPGTCNKKNCRICVFKCLFFSLLVVCTVYFLVQVLRVRLPCIPLEALAPRRPPLLHLQRSTLIARTPTHTHTYSLTRSSTTLSCRLPMTWVIHTLKHVLSFIFFFLLLGSEL